MRNTPLPRVAVPHGDADRVEEMILGVARQIYLPAPALGACVVGPCVLHAACSPVMVCRATRAWQIARTRPSLVASAPSTSKAVAGPFITSPLDCGKIVCVMCDAHARSPSTQVKHNQRAW